MKLLDFEFPEFTRIAWVSDIAREVWQPRIGRIIRAWREIEWLSVTEGVRLCATISVSPEYLFSVGEKVVKAGLVILPLGYQGVQNYSYSNDNFGDNPAGQFLLNVVVGTSENVLNFKIAYETACNSEKIGELLGHPTCCRRFFTQVLEEGRTDTTWPMAVATTNSIGDAGCVQITSDPLINVLWHWLGVRAIPHFPCSFDCKNSLDIAKKYIDVAKKAGYDEEMDWLLEILSWPIQWESLHGIAEIKTPILKISTKTDAICEKHTVKRVADAYPAEGAKGLNFPYSISKSPKQPQPKKCQKDLNCLIKTESPLLDQRSEAFLSESWYYKDNGFNSRVNMDAAHKPVEELAISTLSMSANVLDLGCGNGVLLKKIQAICPKVTPFGIDTDPGRIDHARALLPTFAENFVVGDIINFDSLLPIHQRYVLVMLALSRLEEMNANQVITFGERIQDCCDNLLVYDYWNRNLAEVARSVGIHLLTPAPDVRACLSKFGTKTEILGAERLPSPGQQLFRCVP